MIYLSIARESTCNNPPQFWKNNELRFSNLAQKALIILRGPDSSADVERSFNHAKLISTCKRHSLTTENFEGFLKLAFNGI